MTILDVGVCSIKIEALEVVILAREFVTWGIVGWEKASEFDLVFLDRLFL